MLTPILLAGPTASGKSALALRLAQALNGVVINADALQVYAEWQVLSARPSAADLAAAPHALYGHVSVRHSYSVGEWLRAVAALLPELAARGQRPIIVGGTGLYFTALTEGLAEIPAIPPDIRAEADGISPARMLADLDAATAARIDRANPARIRRAWEVLRATRRGLAEWQADTPPPLLPHAHGFVLNPPRDWLLARCDLRFDQMIAQGALAEAAAVAALNLPPTLPGLRAIGGPELMAHLRGESTLGAAIAAAKQATHAYVKRQQTWFRNKMRSWKILVSQDSCANFGVIANFLKSDC